MKKGQSMKNRYIKLYEKIKNEQLILDSLNYYHRHHVQNASRIRTFYREEFENVFSETEKRFAVLIHKHEERYIKLNRKLNRKTK